MPKTHRPSIYISPAARDDSRPFLCENLQRKSMKGIKKMWKYFNPNPDGLKTNDCTIRAICAVTGLDWYTVHDALCAKSRTMSDMPSTDRVWWALLEDFDYEQVFLQQRCPDCTTVRDFALAHPHGLYILAPYEHAVAVVDGDWLDSWDSGSTVPAYYFRRRRNGTV